jgi:Beta-eliminating lyase
VSSNDDDLLALRDQCTRFLAGHGPVRTGDLLATIPADTAVDRYSDGGVVAELEGEIAALFDTVYVSFYKGIGALPGCCVAGPDDIVAEVREWRRRMGGTLWGLWPNAASALTCLKRRLPLMPRYLSHAQAIADALKDLPGVRVVPDPPQVPMMHLLLATSQEGYAAAARRLAAEQGTWTWPQAMTTGDPAVQRVELSVGDGTCALDSAEIRDLIAALVA